MSAGTVVFVLSGSTDWKKSLVDSWQLDCIELDGSEQVLGHRQLDGSIVKVLKTSDGKLIALAKK